MNIFEQFGIKEVANVTFEALDDYSDGSGIKKGDIVMYLDTLKVSTVEETAETTDARGGWANPKLITWDYNKDITVTLEDAVVSWEELRIMMGASLKTPTTDTPIVAHASAEAIIPASTSTAFTNMPTGLGSSTLTMQNGKYILPANWPASGDTGTAVKIINLTNGKRIMGTASGSSTSAAFTGVDASAASTFLTANTENRLRIFWEVSVTSSTTADASALVISPDTFPGTYKVVGDALIRNKATGKDEAFQFVINKAKLSSEVTLTMQAEGDPSTFSMTLNVLRDEQGDMMSLQKYDI